MKGFHTPLSKHFQHINASLPQTSAVIDLQLPFFKLLNGSSLVTCKRKGLHAHSKRGLMFSTHTLILLHSNYCLTFLGTWSAIQTYFYGIFFLLLYSCTRLIYPLLSSAVLHTSLTICLLHCSEEHVCAVYKVTIIIYGISQLVHEKSIRITASVDRNSSKVPAASGRKQKNHNSTYPIQKSEKENEMGKFLPFSLPQLLQEWLREMYCNYNLMQ